jgi:hypothetical protein
MTQNEILTMLHKVVAENQQYTTWTVSTPHLVALVNQAIEVEREACAKLCEDFDSEISDCCANAIRARAQADRG